jgi:hypothetical protein
MVIGLNFGTDNNNRKPFNENYLSLRLMRLWRKPTNPKRFSKHDVCGKAVRTLPLPQAVGFYIGLKSEINSSLSTAPSSAFRRTQG